MHSFISIENTQKVEIIFKFLVYLIPRKGNFKIILMLYFLKSKWLHSSPVLKETSILLAAYLKLSHLLKSQVWQPSYHETHPETSDNCSITEILNKLKPPEWMGLQIIFYKKKIKHTYRGRTCKTFCMPDTLHI